MKILSIDTASNLCTVAILEDKSCIKEIIVNDARNHSEKIMPVIEQTLQEAVIKDPVLLLEFVLELVRFLHFKIH